MPRLPSWFLATLIAIGVCFRVAAILRVDWNTSCPDFPVFYAAGKLAFTPDLYSAQHMRTIQASLVPCVPQNAVFIRLPYLAAVLSLFSVLPYSQAHIAWGLLSFTALALFVWLWPAPRALTLLACAWSVPLEWNFNMGQDVAFLLLWLAIGLALLKRGREFAAGLVFSLCVAKFHLFLLAPLVLWRWRMWKVVKGIVAGVAILVTVSFAVAGWNWPARLSAVLSSPVMDPSPWMMPTLAGLASRAPHAAVLEFVSAAMVAALVWYVVRRNTKEIGLAAALIGGLLVSHHAYPADALLVLPACLTAAYLARRPLTTAAAVVPLAPVLYQLPHRLAWASAAVAFCALLAAIAHDNAPQGRLTSHSGT